MRSALCLVVLAGCLESSPPPPAPVADAPAPRLMKAAPAPFVIEPPAPKAAPEPLDRDGELRDPVRDGRLALIPIVEDRPEDQAYLTLRVGMASGEVVVLDQGVIERISVTNRSSRPLVILGGEMVAGGHQDRLITRTTVLPPHRTQQVATVCGELGRSDGPSWRFHAAVGLAEPGLRKLARAEDQLEVWDRIEALTGSRGASYRHAAAAQRAGVNAARLHHLTSQLDAVDRREEHARTVGFAVALDDKVIAIERFASPALFRELRETVIASYLPGSSGKPRDERSVGPAQVRAFAEAVRGAAAPVPPRSPAAARSAAPPALR